MRPAGADRRAGRRAGFAGRLPWAIAVLAWIAGGVPLFAGKSADPFAECESEVRARPEANEAYLCFHRVAQRTGLA